MNLTFTGTDRCRGKVCVVGYEKTSCMLLDLERETVDKFLIDGYKSMHSDFACGICTGCSTALSKKRKKFGLRSVGTCSCMICAVAKRNGLSVLQLSRKKYKRVRPISKPVPSHKKICWNC